MSSKIKNCLKIDSLIRRKATGTPASLAKKVGLSETYVKRLIGYMKIEYHMPIEYSLEKGYVYKKPGKFYIGWVDEEAQ